MLRWCTQYRIVPALLETFRFVLRQSNEISVGLSTVLRRPRCACAAVRVRALFAPVGVTARKSVWMCWPVFTPPSFTLFSLLFSFCVNAFFFPRFRDGKNRFALANRDELLSKIFHSRCAAPLSRGDYVSRIAFDWIAFRLSFPSILHFRRRLRPLVDIQSNFPAFGHFLFVAPVNQVSIFAPRGDNHSRTFESCEFFVYSSSVRATRRRYGVNYHFACRKEVEMTHGDFGWRLVCASVTHSPRSVGEPLKSTRA